tara:strand:+ start:136 stop:1014 length:879 start_codon:yes stop_codon:yes gene_type:complete
MKKEALRISYDNLDRDVFFASVIKGKKDRTDFEDTAKCMLWEENRTRYFTDERFRTLVNCSKILRKLYENLIVRADKTKQKEEAKIAWKNYVQKEITPNFSLQDLAKIDFYQVNYPYNVSAWPEKAYLSHAPKVRKTWKYDPLEDKKNYESLYTESIGDKVEKMGPEGMGKVVTLKLPVTIQIDPLYDESNLKRVLLENVNEIMEMAKLQQGKMEKEGYAFRKEKPKDQRPRSWYETGLRYLGHYRLHKCEGWEFHDVEKAFEKASQKMDVRPIERATFMKKAKKELRVLPF